MAASVYLGFAQFLIGIVLLIFASYSDIKLRKASDLIWVAMGFSGLIILGIMIIDRWNADEVESIVMPGLIPLIGILSYFLMCDWLVDFEAREMNLPWILVLIVSIIAVLNLCYLAGINSVQIVFVCLFFVFFLALEFIMFYLDHKNYIENKRAIEAKKKPVKKKVAQKPGPKKERESEKDEVEKSEQTETWVSWIIAILLIILLVLGFAVQNGHNLFSLSISVIVPVVIFILYLVFFKWQLMPETPGQTHDAVSEKPELEIIIRKRSIGELLGWTILIIFGILLIINMIYVSQLDEPPEFFNAAEENPRYFLALFSATIWLLIFYALYNLGIPKGGADTKALMAITVLFPMYLYFEQLLLINAFKDLTEVVTGIQYIFPFAFTILMNATIVTALIPLTLLIYNASKKDLKFPVCFFGYKMDLKSIPEKHVWIMYRFDDNDNVRTVLSPGDVENNVELISKLKKKGLKDAWVTPKIPFIVPLTIGFVLNYLVGNIIFALIYGIQGL